MKCLRCKRALKDPKSVERQYGPVCWGKVRAEQEQEEEEGVRAVGHRNPHKIAGRAVLGWLRSKFKGEGRTCD